MNHFSDFVGMSLPVKQLENELALDKGVHAYLFTGIAGTGKFSIAQVCARVINCTGARKPCDECASCKLYLNRSHPDHIVIEPEKSIGVEEVRSLTSRVAVKPFGGGRHTVVIRHAEKMTVQAQNALLKTLESPPGDAVFFLLAEQPLLPTIQSRCRPVRFTPVCDEDVAKALARRGIDRARAESSAREAQGSVGRAIMLAEDEAYWELRDRVVLALNALHGPGDVGLAALKLGQESDRSALILQIIEGLARELLKHQVAPSENAKPALRSDLCHADRLLLAVRDAKMKGNSNVRWQYALEMLFFDLLAQPLCI